MSRTLALRSASERAEREPPPTRAISSRWCVGTPRSGASSSDSVVFPLPGPPIMKILLGGESSAKTIYRRLQDHEARFDQRFPFVEPRDKWAGALVWGEGDVNLPLLARR